MLQPRPSLNGPIVRPTAYNRFDSDARNQWIDTLLQKIDGARHPRESPGPSRSPSPLEVTYDGLAQAGSEGDGLFAGDLVGDDTENAGQEENMLFEGALQVIPNVVSSAYPDHGFDVPVNLGSPDGWSSHDDGSLVQSVKDSDVGVESYEVGEPDREGNEGRHFVLSHGEVVWDDRAERLSESLSESQRSDDEYEGDDIQYIGSSDEETASPGRLDMEDEENEEDEDDQDEGEDDDGEVVDGVDSEQDEQDEQDEQTAVDDASLGRYEAYSRQSIYPRLPEPTVILGEEELEVFRNDPRSICAMELEDEYQAQSIYPQLDSLPSHPPNPSDLISSPEGVVTRLCDDIVFSEDIVDPALLTDIALQAEALGSGARDNSTYGDGFLEVVNIENERVERIEGILNQGSPAVTSVSQNLTFVKWIVPLSISCYRQLLI